MTINSSRARSGGWLQAKRSVFNAIHLLLLAWALSGCASAVAPRAAAGPTPETRGRASPPSAPSPLVVPIDAATRARLPRERVQASAHARALDCEGVPLAALLRDAGAMPETKLPGAMLSRYVLVDARDGYRVLYSLAELDPHTGARRVLLVDRCNGAPLDGEDGPLRLIASDDVRPARWVRQVRSIVVVAAP
jgi:hypothetical protein